MRTLTVLALTLIASAVSAQTPSVFIEDLTWPEIRDAQAAGKTSAIIYAGGTEQNGPHMALIKHNLIARHVAGRAAERLGNALVFPILPFSPAGNALEKTGHMRFPGTITLSSEVYLGVMRQVAESAAAGGFKNIFLMGDHGIGQAEIRLAAESLDGEWRARGVRVYYVPDVFQKASQQMNAYLSERKIRGGGHAGVTETAQVRFLDPDGRWIRSEKMSVSAAGPEPETGVGGDPSPATVEMGRVFIDYKIAAVVDQVHALLAGE